MPNYIVTVRQYNCFEIEADNEEKAKETAKKQAGSAPQKKNGSNGPAGRPSGTKSPQSTKRVSPVGASQNYVLSLVKDNFIKADKLNRKVEVHLRRKHKVKELNEEQKSVAFEITKLIVANEDVEHWDKLAKVKSYVQNPVDTNPKRVQEIQEIAYEHQVDDYVASILYLSKK